MSATICYRPLSHEHKSLGVAAPSRFLEVMGKCFGDPPFTLKRADIPFLSGMAAAWSDYQNPFNDIIEQIKNYDAIEVWAEY